MGGLPPAVEVGRSLKEERTRMPIEIDEVDHGVAENLLRVDGMKIAMDKILAKLFEVRSEY